MKGAVRNWRGGSAAGGGEGGRRQMLWRVMCIRKVEKSMADLGKDAPRRAPKVQGCNKTCQIEAKGCPKKGNHFWCMATLRHTSEKSEPKWHPRCTKEAPKDFKGATKPTKLKRKVAPRRATIPDVWRPSEKLEPEWHPRCTKEAPKDFKGATKPTKLNRKVAPRRATIPDVWRAQMVPKMHQRDPQKLKGATKPTILKWKVAPRRTTILDVWQTVALRQTTWNQMAPKMY